MTKKQERESGYSSMAVGSLILSIASWLVLGIVLAPTAIILGIKAQKSQESGTRTMATIGIIIASVGLIFLFFMLMLALAAAGYR